MAFASSTASGSRTVSGKKVAMPVRSARVQDVRKMVVRAEATPDHSRRAALGLIAGVGAVLSAKPSEAAYGEAANIFGKPTNTSGFLSYAGDGYSLLIPAKWNPGEERDFPGSILRWEDNGDQLTHVLVTRNKTDKTSIDQYGPPEKFLETISNYIGQQSFSGATLSEGGFDENKVSSASLLDVSTSKDNAGKTYYKYNLLVRAADGNEGGRHVLLSATVGGGDLYVAKVQCGDKRWFKGADKEATTALDSFTVA
ncbi:hypothetical protein BSKO_02905 [Bryopsis sp. KO-2023]|nr:hypothetical protein BSKO_02905 [Bryopsis sp. KO-2023]